MIPWHITLCLLSYGNPMLWTLPQSFPSADKFLGELFSIKVEGIKIWDMERKSIFKKLSFYLQADVEKSKESGRGYAATKRKIKGSLRDSSLLQMTLRNH